MLALGCRGIGKVSDQGLRHVAEARHVRALVAGRAGVDDVLALRHLAFGHGLGDDLHEVIADRLRKASGVDGDDVRVVEREDRLDGLQQVGLPAKDGCALRKRTGRGHHRFLVMLGERRAVIAAAALRAVAVRQTVVQSQGGVHGAHGLAGFGRIDGERSALQNLVGSVA